MTSYLDQLIYCVNIDKEFIKIKSFSVMIIVDLIITNNWRYTPSVCTFCFFY